MASGNLPLPTGYQIQQELVLLPGQTSWHQGATWAHSGLIWWDGKSKHLSDSESSQGEIEEWWED